MCRCVPPAASTNPHTTGHPAGRTGARPCDGGRGYRRVVHKTADRLAAYIVEFLDDVSSRRPLRAVVFPGAAIAGGVARRTRGARRDPLREARA